MFPDGKIKKRISTLIVRGDVDQQAIPRDNNFTVLLVKAHVSGGMTGDQ
jgi:hypothetical protein